MNKETITVVVVDDHKLMRLGLKKILAEYRNIKVVGEAASGEEAIQLVRELKPIVVLMDIRMPGIGGVEASRKILHFNPDCRILIVTVCNDVLHPARLLQAGASGYVTKDCDSSELAKAISEVSMGRRYVSPAVAQKMVLNNQDGKSPFTTLSARELQIVKMVTEGIKAPEIARKLNLSSKTINTYRYRVFKKLNLKGDVQLTHLALNDDLAEPA